MLCRPSSLTLQRPSVLVCWRGWRSNAQLAPGSSDPWLQGPALQQATAPLLCSLPAPWWRWQQPCRPAVGGVCRWSQPTAQVGGCSVGRVVYVVVVYAKGCVWRGGGGGILLTPKGRCDRSWHPAGAQHSKHVQATRAQGNRVMLLWVGCAQQQLPLQLLPAPVGPACMVWMPCTLTTLPCDATLHHHIQAVFLAACSLLGSSAA
jgi:hypothetical protein